MESGTANLTLVGVRCWRGNGAGRRRKGCGIRKILLKEYFNFQIFSKFYLFVTVSELNPTHCRLHKHRRLGHGAEPVQTSSCLHD
jgi:hypothetical protein